jgi:hypothetical protein
MIASHNAWWCFVLGKTRKTSRITHSRASKKLATQRRAVRCALEVENTVAVTITSVKRRGTHFSRGFVTYTWRRARKYSNLSVGRYPQVESIAVVWAPPKSPTDTRAAPALRLKTRKICPGSTPSVKSPLWGGRFHAPINPAGKWKWPAGKFPHWKLPMFKLKLF